MNKITNEQISSLVETVVVKSLSTKSLKKYQETITEFQGKLQAVQGNEYANADDFVLECLSLFDEVEEDGPEEVYRGLNRQDIELFLNNLVRRFKEALCNTLHQHPDHNFSDATKAVYDESIKVLVASVLQTAGIPDFFTAIMLSAYLTYISRSGIQEICS